MHHPTIKWGDPSALEDYEGGRDYDDLEKFAAENLKPMCSPSNIDLCDPEKKAQIEELKAKSADELDAMISAEESKLEAAEEEFKKEVEKLQKKSISTDVTIFPGQNGCTIKKLIKSSLNEFKMVENTAGTEIL